MDDIKTFQTPYNISWATFLSVAERMAADPPNRVDRTYLNSQSGFIQTYLIAAYKAFGFIGEDARPTDLTKIEFANPDRRQGVIADLLRANYPTIIPLGETNSTHGELQEAFASAFPNITGQSRTKAIRFFLSGAEYAGIKTAPLWKTPKAPRGGSAPRRAATKRKSAASDAKKPEPDGGSSGGTGREHTTVTLGPAGTVSIDVKVKWLDLTDDQFTKLRKLIKDIEALGDSGS